MEAIERLGKFHPFFGITFLVCKENSLPIGSKASFSINSAEKRFLKDFYHPDVTSDYFFQPFRTSSRLGHWISSKYPSSGSQSTRTRGHFAAAFLHDRGTDQWGWSESYVEVLAAKLRQDGSGQVPIIWLAMWLFRNEKWPNDTALPDIVGRFIKRFSINQKEIHNIFDPAVPELGHCFGTEPFDDPLMLGVFGPAPDAFPREGGTLSSLELRNIGPAARLSFDPAERLSIITGDNGLGKTFILECAWWALTGKWAERAALPSAAAQRATPSINFTISGGAGGRDQAGFEIAYDWGLQTWPDPKGRPTIPGLIVYARVDGSFAVWDPVRHGDHLVQMGKRTNSLLVFTRDDVLNGLGDKIEGLIRDWVRWQNARDQSTFEMFCKVLERLSPPDMTPLRPGEPIRMSGDARDIPTLVHEYAVVPFTNESAGVKRVITVAYLLVWAWNEHRIFSQLARKDPQNNLVIMVDEIEAHLHPKWQRSILPALLDVVKVLGKEVRSQVIVATHSPLILASMESVFAGDLDKLFHLHVESKKVKFEEIAFLKHGTVDAWLTSEVFELKQARSREGESAFERARQILAASETNPALIREVHRQLAEVLPAEDPFWPRWLHFADMKGVKL
jgi:hypothetical protein